MLNSLVGGDYLQANSSFSRKKKCPDRLVMPTTDMGDIDICRAITFYGFPPKDASVDKGPHSGEAWQMQWIFGNCGNSYIPPAVRGIANEQKRKGY